jgi:hypothetical protein
VSLAEILSVYAGSDGDATKALYQRLTDRGPLGGIAAGLLRAQKNSARAKVYRGRRYRDVAYDRKQWALGLLTEELERHGDRLGIRWGWGDDPEQSVHRAVLYVDLPTGQVSFHSDHRGDGPDYPDQWDGIRGVALDRIIRFAARMLRADGAAT